jgi:sugar transferase EpsL
MCCGAGYPACGPAFQRVQPPERRFAARIGCPTLKRAIDLAVALSAGTLLLPLILVIALAIRITMGAPVLFRQRRIGRGERPFTIYKFRTMTAGEAADAERLTPLGRFLRRSSLDELPQLWNVLRGEMSLVGPRPLLPQYLPRYTARQRRRHEVTPGITGWAQVHGRNQVGWEDRFELDIWYVEHASLALDLRILWLTARQVLHSSGVSHGEHATMPEFQGTRGIT